MENGYPFIFQMNDYPLEKDGLLECTLQYRFTSSKSRHKYIVRVERYKEHAYCVKFFDKANMASNDKFSLRTGTFEVRTILYTLFNIMLDVLKRDEAASFFFIGENDEKDLPGHSTRRYRVYVKFVSSVVGNTLFAHHRNDPYSLYVLTNRKYVSDHDKLRDEITRHVISELTSFHSR